VDILQRRPSAARQLKEKPMSNPNVADELRKAEVEPLLPIEKKLIAWSLGIGIVLLVILAVITRLYPVSI
jgi:hypothetical protein